MKFFGCFYLVGDARRDVILDKRIPISQTQAFIKVQSFYLYLKLCLTPFGLHLVVLSLAKFKQ